MPTNSTPVRPVWRSHVTVAVMTVCVVAIASVAGARQVDGDEDLPFTNHRRAQEDLAWAQENLEAVRLRLAEREAEFDALHAEAAELAGQEEALVRDVLESRHLAAEYIVTSYVTGRLGVLGANLLATDHLMDALYLQAIVNNRVAAVAEAYADHEQLLQQSGEHLLFVLDRIDVVYRDTQLAQRDLPLLEERLAEAQWVAYVAEIHGRADVELVRRQRPNPSPAQWAALRHCESTENYLVNTGNGYYGAYQFDQSTWESVGGTGRPHWAVPVVQDARARLLYALRGAAPWPICGRYLP